MTPEEDIELYLQQYLTREINWPYSLIYNVIWDYYDDKLISKEERDYFRERLDEIDIQRELNENGGAQEDIS